MRQKKKRQVLKKVCGKLKVIVTTGVISIMASALAWAMPADVGGTWDGYDSYEDWFYSINGYYPSDNPYDVPENSYGTWGEVKNPYWNGSTARWDYDGDPNKFQVKLYRGDEHLVCVKTVTKPHYSFTNDFEVQDYYYFRVRCHTTSGWSQWEESDAIYRGSVQVHSISSHSSTRSGGPNPANGQWIQTADGTGRWWYRHADGCYTVNNWEFINGKWYYFDSAGWMAVGWVNWKGHAYYLDGSGAMVTGSYVIDGVSHNFDASGMMIN